MKHTIVFLMAMVMVGSLAFAGDGPSNDEVMAKLQELQQTVNVQNARIQELQSQLDSKSFTEPSADAVRALIRQELAANPGAGMPAWLDGLLFDAELRLRYEWSGDRRSYDDLESDLVDDDRSRFQYMLRFGFQKAVTEELMVRFELASGVWDFLNEGWGWDLTYPGDPTTHYSTMGDGFAKDRLWIQQAFLTYAPTDAPGWLFIAGRHVNNWDTVGSELIWDEDMSAEGFQARYNFCSADNVQSWAQIEYMLIMESFAPDFASSWEKGDVTDAIAVQVGSTIDMDDGMDLTLAASYFCMDDVTSLPAWTGRTNSVDGDWIVSDFDLYELAGEFGFVVDEMPCSVFADYARNQDDRAGSQDTAWKVGLRVGEVKQKGDWSAQYDYSYVERDAIIALLGNDDRGWSNYRGHGFRVDYGLLTNTTLTGKVYCLDVTHNGDAVFGEVIHDTYIKGQIELAVKF